MRKKTAKHPWRVQNLDNGKTLCIPRHGKEIPVARFKEVALQFSPPVGPVSIIISAISESIRKFLGNVNSKQDVVYLVTPLPKPDHPNGLANHFELSGVLKLPKFEGTLSQSTKYVDNLYISRRDDEMYHFYMQTCYSLTAVLPKPLRIALPAFKAFVTVASNVPGNDVEFCVDNLPCTNFTICAGQGTSSFGKYISD